VNNSRLFIALAILVGLGAAAVVTTRSRESRTTLEKPTATLPAIKKEELTELEIAKPGRPTIVLKKQGDKWSLTAPLAAEANMTAVDGALDKLTDLKVAGIAATRKENHERLEVDAAHGIRVKAKGGDKQLLDMYVGASKSSGTLVRVEGQEPVLTVRGSIRYAFDKEPKDFRKREITDLDAAELTAIAFSSSKGSFKFERPATEGAVWTQAKGEKPIAKFDPAQVESLVGTAADLRAADFAEPGEAPSNTGLDAPSAKVALTKKDGTTVEVAIGKQHAAGNDYYARATGSDVVYRLAKYSADRLMPDAKFFEKVEKPPQAAAPEGMPPMGMGLPGGSGSGQISPEMMQQIQRQLAAQGGHP
jgi:hypothetical protein